MNLKRLVLIFTAAIFLLVPNWAFAGVSIQVKPGLNGLYKNHKPVQLNIAVYNDGPAVKDALLRVVADRDKARSSSSRAVYQRVIDLLPKGRIETFIIIPGELAADQPEVQLIAGGRMLDSAVVQGMAVKEDYVVVSVGEKPLANGLPYWLENSFGYNTIKYLPPADLPRNPIALAAADVIIIDKERAPQIQPEQAKAIRQWVALGGNLILSGGAGAAEGEPFAIISPVLVTGNTSLGGNWNGMRTESIPIPLADGKFVRGKSY
ncbi:MAG: hypothetical protein H0Z40_06170 [Desulfotomaculum sp.]|nr:hypothetical protein [Desulfotomaculum sp.]